MEKAIIGCGQYRLKAQYKFLGVPEEAWFKMSTEQRLRHVKKFNTCRVRTHAGTSVSATKETDQQLDKQEIVYGNFKLNAQGISMSHEEAFANTKVPHATAEGIWNKATMLIAEENAIVVAPGCGPKDKMVKSKSGTVLHLVTATNDLEYKCDDKCPQYKSLFVCSHAVAAAQFNGEVKEFMEWYRRRHGNHQPSFIKLAVHDMPAAAGRKGGKLPRKRVNRSYVSTNENHIPLKCSQRVNIDGASAPNGSPCISQQPTTNYVTNSHVSNVTVPNLPVSPFPSYNMPTPPYPYYSSQPYYSSPSFGIGGAVPMTVFPSTPSPVTLPIPESGPTGVNHYLTPYFILHILCRLVLITNR